MLRTILSSAPVGQPIRVLQVLGAVNRSGIETGLRKCCGGGIGARFKWIF
jgi:hypothetical protein